jgi:hypothetical protein
MTRAERTMANQRCVETALMDAPYLDVCLMDMSARADNPPYIEPTMWADLTLPLFNVSGNQVPNIVA